jgi:hypothetical protein
MPHYDYDREAERRTSLAYLATIDRLRKERDLYRQALMDIVGMAGKVLSPDHDERMDGQRDSANEIF